MAGGWGLLCRQGTIVCKSPVCPERPSASSWEQRLTLGLRRGERGGAARTGPAPAPGMLRAALRRNRGPPGEGVAVTLTTLLPAEVVEKVNELIARGRYGRLFAVVHFASHQWKVTSEDLILIENNLDIACGERIRLEKVRLWVSSGDTAGWPGGHGGVRGVWAELLPKGGPTR